MEPQYLLLNKILFNFHLKKVNRKINQVIILKKTLN